MAHFTFDRIVNQFKNYDLGTMVIELNRERDRLEHLKHEIGNAEKAEYLEYQEEINCFLHLLQTGKLSDKIQPESVQKFRQLSDILIERGHLPASFSTVFG